MTLKLFSVEDYLVVKREYQLLMLLGFMVPAVHRETEWYRFERATRVPEVETNRLGEMTERWDAAFIAST